MRHGTKKEGEDIVEGIQKVETMTPYEAGKIVGKNADFIRIGLQQGRFPFR